MQRTRTFSLALTGVFAALICVATLLIQIPIPATGGYANLGDGMLLIASAILPLPHAALAAGLGSALADLLLGYMTYAPGTLIIKGLMALLSGLLLRSLQNRRGLYLLAGLAAECLMVLGYFLYEAVVLGLHFGAAAGLAGNAAQGLVGMALFACAGPLLSRHLNK